MPIISDSLSAFPRAHYGCFLADPPWRFKSWSPKGNLKHSAEVHYPTMTLADIKAMPIGDLAAKNAWLFLWITGPFAAIGAHVDVMKAWGFKPSALGLAWVKLLKRETGALLVSPTRSFHIGQGKTTRHNAELCFLGRRGHPPRLSRAVRELIISPVSQHSRKPIEAHERIEQFCAGPRLELFARRIPSTANAHEWDLFGNEVAPAGYQAVA